MKTLRGLAKGACGITGMGAIICFLLGGGNAGYFVAGLFLGVLSLWLHAWAKDVPTSP